MVVGRIRKCLMVIVFCSLLTPFRLQPSPRIFSGALFGTGNTFHRLLLPGVFFLLLVEGSVGFAIAGGARMDVTNRPRPFRWRRDQFAY